MLNKSLNEMKSIKTRENEGWVKLNQQLNLEMPLKKKKDKAVIWFFFAFGLGILGYAWYNIDPAKKFNKIVPSIESIQSTSQETALAPETMTEKKTNVADNALNPVGNKSPQSESISSNTNGNRLGANNYLSEPSSRDKSQLKKTIDSDVKSQKKVDQGNILITNEKAQAVNTSTTFSKAQKDDLTSENIPSVKSIESKSNENNSTQVKDIVNPSFAAKESNEVHNAIATESNSSTRSSHHLAIDFLPSSMLLLDAKRKLTLPNPFASNTFVDQVKGINIKRLHGYIQANGDLAFNEYTSIGLALGLSTSLSRKWHWNNQIGLGYQFSKNQVLDIVGNQSSNNPASFSADVKPQYTVEANKVYLDASNAVTRYVSNALFISNADQILITKSSHASLHFQSTFDYFLSSKWYVESGIVIRKSLNNNNQLLQVSNNGNGNKVGISTVNTTSNYRIIGLPEPYYIHMLIQSGYRIHRRLDINISLVTASVWDFKKLKFGSEVNLDASPIAAPFVSSTRLILPDPENGGFLRLGLKYRIN